ncbi:MAG: hypothetical protein U1E43_01095 [Rhodospirillales bacterium]
MTALLALQLTIATRYLELSALLLDGCLRWLPTAADAEPLPPSRSLVAINLSAAS